MPISSYIAEQSRETHAKNSFARYIRNLYMVYIKKVTDTIRQVIKYASWLVLGISISIYVDCFY